MKRVNSDLIHTTVLSYLKKRNYIDQSSESFSTKHLRLTSSLEEFTLQTVMQQETGAKNLVSCDSCSASPSESTSQFVHLAAFIKDSPSEFKNDIEKFIFPIFVHLFLEMIYNGHKAEAHGFYSKHHDLIEALSGNKEILQSLAEVMSTVDILNSPLLITLRECKFRVEITHDALQYLLRYLQSQDTTLILKVLNFHIHIEVKHGPGESASSVPKEETEKEEAGDSGAREDGEENYYRADTIDHSAEELRKTLEAVRDGAPSAPSVLLYTFLNAYQGHKVEELRKTLEAVRDRAPSAPSVLYTLLNAYQCLSCASYSHEKEIIVGGYEDSALRLWTTGQQKMKTTRSAADVSRVRLSGDCIGNDDTQKSSLSDYEVLRGHSGPVYSCNFLPESDVMLSCSEDTTIRAWQFSTCSNVAVYRGHSYPVWDIDVSPLFFASASKDGTARLWSTERTFPLRIYCGHMMDVDCVKFHPNCKYMATGSNDKSIRLWDINEAKSVRLFTGHRSTVISLAFSPDGKYLASAGEDRRIKIWDLGSGGVVKELRGHGDTVYSICFSPDGSMMASGGIDNSIRMWDVRTNFEDQSSSQSSNTSRELIKQFSTKSVHIHQLQFIKSNLVTAVGGTTHS